MPIWVVRTRTSPSFIVGIGMSMTIGLSGASKTRAFIFVSCCSMNRLDPASSGGADYRFEEGDVVHQFLPGYRIFDLAAHGTGKGFEIVEDWLGRADLADVDTGAGVRPGDNPA